MFNAMNEKELMDTNGGIWAVPYYASLEDKKIGKTSGYKWTCHTNCAYVLGEFEHNRNDQALDVYGHVIK